MKTLLFPTLLSIAIAAFHTPAYAAQPNETAITIYSKALPGAVDTNMYRPVNGQNAYYGITIPGYAIIRQRRNVMLDKKETILKFTDVAALIDPTTVQFTSLTDPKNTKVAEQSYQFDLVSQQKLLEKYVDKTITVEKTIGDKTEKIEGTLLSVQGGLTLKMPDGGIKAVNNYSALNFSELPGGLITKPTLVWDIITNKTGEHTTEVSYETAGVTWWADYNLTFHEGKDANSGTVDFGSWVSIINQSGTSYKDAKLKLIAGDVEKISTPQFRNEGMVAAKAMMMDAAAPSAPKFDEKSFFEYHLYTLNRPVTLEDNATKQLELIPAVKEVPVEKMLVLTNDTEYWNYDSMYLDQNAGLTSAPKKADVILSLKNKEENGLGIPLPAGRIRVNQQDNDGSLEFIGENTINHTPRNETLTIRLGQAFDVVAERRQVNYMLDSRNHFAEEEIEIKVRNQKKQAVKVKVVENLYRATGWKILESNQDYKKENAHQIHYLVTIGPEKEQIITYKVRYNW